MGDEAPKKPPSLTIEDVLAFFTDRKVSPLCPSCGQNTWTFLGEPDGLVPGLTLQREEGAFTIPPPIVPMVVLLCNNCYFIRAFARIPILEWMKSKGKPA